MATRTWISNASTDWNQTANWSGGAVPNTSDDVVFDGTGQASIKSWPAAVSLASLIITEGYTGEIGTDSAALTIDVNATAASILRCSGRGRYYKFNGTVRNCDVKLVGTQLFGIAGGTWGASGGTNGLCRFTGGKVLADAAATLDFVRIGGGSDADISSAAAIDQLILDGITAKIRSSVTELHMHNRATATLLNAAAVATGYINGTLIDHSSGTHTLLYLTAASLYTPSGSPFTTKTVTTMVKLSPNAKVVKSVGGTLVVVSSEFGTDSDF